MNLILDDPAEPAEDFLKGLIEEPRYAKKRKCSVRTCQRDRLLGNSPPYVKIGRRVYYRLAAIEAWLLNREQSRTAHRADNRLRSRPYRAGR